MPSDGTCLGEPPEGFCDVGGCCCFYLTGGFYVYGLFFFATGTLLWLLPSPALNSTLAIFGFFTFARLFRHIFTASATVEWAFFTHRCFFTLRSTFSTFLTRFVTQMRAGTPHPGSSSVSALKELSLPAGAWAWATHIVVTRPLIYQLRRWATNYRVKKGYWICFACSKLYGKTIKHFQQDLIKKILLKTTSTKLLNKYSSKLFLKKQPPGKQSSVTKNNQCLMDNRCFWGLIIYSIQNRSTIFRCVLICRQLTLHPLLGCLSIHPHQFECRQKAKKHKAH